MPSISRSAAGADHYQQNRARLQPRDFVAARHYIPHRVPAAPDPLPPFVMPRQAFGARQCGPGHGFSGDRDLYRGGGGGGGGSEAKKEFAYIKSTSKFGPL